MTLKLINTEVISNKYRAAAIDKKNRRLLITNFRGTKQEQDFTNPSNCKGFGRVRHFRRISHSKWPLNPLPIEPACRSLQLEPTNIFRAQVFQNAVCNWRCWYCFVDFSLLAGNKKYSTWLSPSEIMDLYLAEPDRPSMIDLTGGQPDLTPEWVPWMMEEIRVRGLENEIYLWSDDNLSNDYFWRYLSDNDIETITTYSKYGRVCCFKGFNEDSFSFNTQAEPSLYKQQFILMKRLLSLNIDLYSYVTLTSPSQKNTREHIRDFMDRLQSVSEYLPLRTIPLEIQVFTPVQSRMDNDKQRALNNQYVAVEEWCIELEQRFSSKDREKSIVDISLHN